MFGGLSIALSSLYAQRQALETTGNNVANANTEGYSRQRVNMRALGGNEVPSFYANGDMRLARIGRGVQVESIERLRDAFLEARGITEHGNSANVNATQSILGQIETSFAEPSDNGLQAQLSNFWSSWDDVSSHPDDGAARSQLVEVTRTLTSSFNQVSQQLDTLRSTSIDQLTSLANEVNSTAATVASLNKAIKAATVAGLQPNDLLDQRDLLVSKLADMVGVTTKAGEAGSVDVYIGGSALVRESNAYQIETDATGPTVNLRWDNDNDVVNTVTEGVPVQVTTGQAAGIMDAVNNIIPKYQASLDAVANNLIAAVNTQHQAGIDRSGNPGGTFLTGTGAGDIAIDPAIASDPSLIAAAASGAGTMDGENARAMANLADAPGGPDSLYRGLIDTLGVEAQRANRQSDIQKDITSQIDAARSAQSGVNIDEEMTNMVMYQHAYDAAARFMTSIDEALDTLINHTGLVGR